MKINKFDLNKSGIYCIRNIVNNKVYIGKSKNIYNRITQHIYLLRNKSKDENRYLINAWHKYGEDKFEYFVLEYLEFDEQLLKERELFWIETYNAIDRNIGYNLRKDSSTNMICHEETRKLQSENSKGKNNPNFGNHWSKEKKEYMSKLKKQQYKKGVVKPNLEATYKGITNRNENWIKHPELKNQMIEKIRKINTKYKIYQYSKDNELIKIWNCINDIIKENPNFKKHNIYAVCSGEKPSIYGYKWIKILNDDIVQPNMKILD